MKIRTKLYAVASFLAMCIGTGSYVVAGSTLELTQKPREISGIDRESGVAFAAVPTSSDHVIIDASVGGKQIHADIDYKLKTLSIRSFSKANGTSVSLSAQDIVAFQKLLVSLPPAVNSGSRHGNALTSFINFIASAPDASTINISTICGPGSFTPICNQIGGSGVATYTLNKTPCLTKVTASASAMTFGLKETPCQLTVEVGPVCYMPPARGRCGFSSGIFVGGAQRFTQECLNHDVCCDATQKRPPKCGNECADEYDKAVCGFFSAPDCGTTTGHWTDNYGYTYVLKEGSPSFPGTPFSGTVDVTSTAPLCGIWSAAGTRTGTNIVFTATNPSFGSNDCVASFTYSGAYSDCSVANGSWTNSGGSSGSWAWNRTNTVTVVAQPVSVRANTVVSASSQGPANK